MLTFRSSGHAKNPTKERLSMNHLPAASRRTLIRAAAAAAVALAGFPYPALGRVLSAGDGTRAVPAATGSGQSDPGFASGEVTAKTATSLVLTSATGTRIVQIQPGASLWKEFLVTIDQVDLGDSVMARGEPQADGSLAVKPGWAWVNIGQWYGAIIDVGAGGLLVRRRDGQDRRIHYSASLEVIRAANQAPVSGGVGTLVRGVQLGAVGLVLPDRSLRATRIWTY